MTVDFSPVPIPFSSTREQCVHARFKLKSTVDIHLTVFESVPICSITVACYGVLSVLIFGMMSQCNEQLLIPDSF